MTGFSLDKSDLKMLALLQRQARASNLDIAEAAALSPAQSMRRHRRLEEHGVIVAYETRLNAERLGLGLTAFIHVSMERGHVRDIQGFEGLIGDMPDILECYSVTGDFDYVIKVVVADLRALSQFLMDKLMRLPGVSDVRSSVCLRELKCTSALPLPE